MLVIDINHVCSKFPSNIEWKFVKNVKKICALLHIFPPGGRRRYVAGIGVLPTGTKGCSHKGGLPVIDPVGIDPDLPKTNTPRVPTKDRMNIAARPG